MGTLVEARSEDAKKGTRAGDTRGKTAIAVAGRAHWRSFLLTLTHVLTQTPPKLTEIRSSRMHRYVCMLALPPAPWHIHTDTMRDCSCNVASCNFVCCLLKRADDHKAVSVAKRIVSNVYLALIRLVVLRRLLPASSSCWENVAYTPRRAAHMQMQNLRIILFHTFLLRDCFRCTFAFYFGLFQWLTTFLVIFDSCLASSRRERSRPCTYGCVQLFY